MGGTDGSDDWAGVQFGDSEDLSLDPALCTDAMVEEEVVSGGSRRRFRKVGLRSWAVLVALAALATIGIRYLNRPDQALLVTFDGSTVDNVAEVIDGTDAAFVRYIADHHGARSRHARCYFDRVGGRVGTDVAPDLFCGPALFYRGAAPAMFLRYALSPPSGPVHGHVRLHVTSDPASTRLERLPAAAHLERPDGRALPSGADGVIAPPPPPAPLDAFVRVKSSDLPRLPVAPDTAIIGSRDIQVVLKASGVIPYYGHGAGARSAPRGEKLQAFQLQMTQGDVILDSIEHGPEIGLAVNGGPVRPVPFSIDLFDIQYSASETNRYLVAAVSADARSVDLVVTDAGVTQRLSVLDGTAAAGNIVILARSPKYLYGHESSAMTAFASVNANGARSTARLGMQISAPRLGYYSPYGPQHASQPDRALLNVTIDYVSPQLPCPGSSCGRAFDARNLTLLPSGGQPVRAYDIGGSGYAVFDVPASFRTGTVTVAGSTKTEQGWTLTMIHPYRVNISFPG